MAYIWWLPVAAIILAAGIAVYRWRPRTATVRVAHLVEAKRRFHTQRERLEAKFVQLAVAQAPSEGPRWADCYFADDVAYVRNRATGELSAFVAVTIASEPSEEDAVDPQAGTAVFRFDQDHWVTDGRAILNLSPGEAVNHYRSDFEIVGEELAHRS